MRRDHRNAHGPMRDRARALRAEMTDAERRLWSCLRRGQIEDARFRRQQVIGPYIADFACMELRLLVEVDGGQHAERQTYDELRTDWLREKGYVVLRFWNTDVLQNIEGVVETIRESIERLRRGDVPPS